MRGAPLAAAVGNVHRLHTAAPRVAAKSGAKAASNATGLFGVTPDVLRARYNLTAADVGQLDNKTNHQVSWLSSRQPLKPPFFAVCLSVYPPSNTHTLFS